MSRLATCRALVLHDRKIGELHKGITLLTDQRGIIRPIAYGANSARGRLRAACRPFCYGECWLYSRGEHVRISDFRIDGCCSGIAEAVDKFLAATLWAELVMHSYAGGDDPRQTFELLLAALRALDDSPIEQVDRISAQFLWRYTARCGMQPDWHHCARCGRTIAPDEPRGYQRGTVTCAQCTPSDQRPPPDRRHLLSGALVSRLSAPDSFAGCDHQAVTALLHLAIRVAQDGLGHPLRTVAVARGMRHERNR